MSLNDFYYKKDRLNQIRGFCAVVQEGNIHKASEKLMLEPATISKQIITLERDIKLELFDRSNKRKLILNDNGKEFYKKSIEILQSVDGLFNHFHDDLKEKNDKEIKIAGTHSAICYLIPEYIKKFQEKYGDEVKFTVFNIPFADCVKKIIDGDIDLAIWNNIQKIPELNIETIYDFKSNIIIHKDNPLSKIKDDKITYNDLKNQNLLMMDKYEYMKLFDEIIKKYELKGNVCFVNGDWETIKHYIKLNLGIHIYSEIYSKFNKIKDSDIICKNVEHLFPNTQFELITKKGRIFNNNIDNFLKILKF